MRTVSIPLGKIAELEMERPTQDALRALLTRTITKPSWIIGHVSDVPMIYHGHGGALVVDTLGRALICPYSYARVYDDLGRIKEVRKPHHADAYLLRKVLDDEARTSEKPRGEWDERDAYVYGAGTLFHTCGDRAPIRSVSRDEWSSCTRPTVWNGGVPYWRVEYGEGLVDGLYGKPHTSDQFKPDPLWTPGSAVVPKADDSRCWSFTSNWKRRSVAAEASSVAASHGLTTPGATLACNVCGKSVSIGRTRRSGAVRCRAHTDGGWAIVGFESLEKLQAAEHAAVTTGESDLSGTPQEIVVDETQRLWSPEERQADVDQQQYGGAIPDVSEARERPDEVTLGEVDRHELAQAAKEEDD